MSEVERLENLTKVDGLNKDAVVRLLGKLRVSHTWITTLEGTGFLNDTVINISLKENRGNPNIGRLAGRTYLSHYALGRNFDFTQLDGRYDFKNGMLTERVSIAVQCPELYE